MGNEKHIFSETEDDAICVHANNIGVALREFREAVEAADGTSARKFDTLKSLIQTGMNFGKPMYAVGVSVLLVNDNQLLLAKRRNNSGEGLLSTPGGRIEYNEGVEEAAKREFKEECLAELLSPLIIGWRKHNRFGNHYFMFYVRSHGWFGEIRNAIPDKSDDWAWHNIEKLTPDNCTEPPDILQILLG